MDPLPIEILATVLFGLAILHTFSVKRFEHRARFYPSGSIGENLFHLLGEVEAVFGLWAGIFLIGMGFILDAHSVTQYLEGHLVIHAHQGPIKVEFTEPAFVFAIMTVAATRPVLQLATDIIGGIARLLPLPSSVSFFIVALIVGPVLGSFITEPAAMTVTALILKERYYDRGMPSKLMYATIGVLFVNVSIGGTLTHFAAPPVLMVAAKFDWGITHMIDHFGWKSAVAVVVNAVVLAAIFFKTLRRLGDEPATERRSGPGSRRAPWWLVLVHVIFMGGIVINSHHMVVFLGIFLYFLGIAAVTTEHQDTLKLREGLLVGFFLGGLVTFGGLQRWWLAPVLNGLDPLPLFLGATGLTGITDNAALTYLGSQVALIDAQKFALVAGAVAGGGLTVIANAPNPAGYGILKSSFGNEGISPLGLLVSALAPTAVAVVCLWFLPSL